MKKNKKQIETRDQLGELLPSSKYTQAIELGVARGEFSKILLDNNPYMTLFSVDRWAGDRGHGAKQYMEAVTLLRPYHDRNIVYRMSFEEAVPFVYNDFCDLVYIDGYAHQGQENGKTLEQWWDKVKPGGIFAGHDYHQRWPLTIKAVDRFAYERNLKIYVTKEQSDNVRIFPSWYIFKDE